VECPSEKKKPTPTGLLQQGSKPVGVVDGRDVVGVEGVAQPERVGQTAKGQEARMLDAIREEQSPTGQVQKPDRAEEGAQARTLTRIEGPPDQSPG